MSAFACGMMSGRRHESSGLGSALGSGLEGAPCPICVSEIPLKRVFRDHSELLPHQDEDGRCG